MGNLQGTRAETPTCSYRMARQLVQEPIGVGKKWSSAKKY